MLHRFGDWAPAREIKFAPCDLKRVAPDGTFSGYASVFGKEDMGRDIVLPGAFADSLRTRGPSGIKLLFQHDPNEPIGVWLELKEDARGLFARGRLMQEVARAREVLSLMRAGALDGLSIGFRTVAGRTDPKTGVRRLHKIDLWEISVVTFPLLPDARVETVKRRRDHDGFGSNRSEAMNVIDSFRLERDAGGKVGPTFPHPAACGEGAIRSLQQLTRWLTAEAGLTRAQAGALMRAGFKALANASDAARGTEPHARLAGALRRAAGRMQATAKRMR